jgi:hypothetical protein
MDNFSFSGSYSSYGRTTPIVDLADMSQMDPLRHHWQHDTDWLSVVQRFPNHRRAGTLPFSIGFCAIASK